MNRRRVLRGIGAAAGTVPMSAAIGGLHSVAAAPRKKLELPPWAYGRSSVAADTVLMFRGNGPHTFYGTGPISESAPEVRWRFRTSVIHNTVRGTPMIWAGTGWTGTAVKLGDYVFVGSVGGYVYALDAQQGTLKWRLRGGGMFKGSL
ncbi:MAG: hypothetical protein AAF732_02645, partial [Pseudomonadota bacterium]